MAPVGGAGFVAGLARVGLVVSIEQVDAIEGPEADRLHVTVQFLQRPGNFRERPFAVFITHLPLADDFDLDVSVDVLQLTSDGNLHFTEVKAGPLFGLLRREVLGGIRAFPVEGELAVGKGRRGR